MCGGRIYQLLESGLVSGPAPMAGQRETDRSHAHGPFVRADLCSTVGLRALPVAMMMTKSQAWCGIEFRALIESRLVECPTLSLWLHARLALQE